MPAIEIKVRRFSVISSGPFDEVVRRLTTAIGRPDMNAFRRAIAAATTVDELEDVVRQAIGSSGLMEFVRFDAGEILRKGRQGPDPKILRLVVGNPLIMKEMAKTVPIPPRTRPSPSSSTSVPTEYTCPTTRWRA